MSKSAFLKGKTLQEPPREDAFPGHVSHIAPRYGTRGRSTKGRAILSIHVTGELSR